MNSPEMSRPDITILNLLDKFDESRDQYDISLANGDRFSADLWLRRIKELAKEIDDVMIAKEPA